MSTEECIIRFSRPEAAGTTIPGPLLRELLDVLVEAVEQSLRLRTEGRSRAPGTPPAWLEQASAFAIDTSHMTSESITLIAPKLASVAPEQFKQGDLFLPSPIDPQKETALDVFTEALHDSVEGVSDSDRYDEALLDTFKSFSRVLRFVDRIEVVNGTTQYIDRERIEALETLEKRIPPPQRALLAGKLDLLQYTGRAFVLVLENGNAVRGVFTGPQDEFERLGQLWKSDVVLAGVTKFRPSGRVLRLEAESIRPASQQEMATLSQLPVPLLGRLDERQLRVPQGPRSGVAAIFGQWPGEESDEEVERALRTLS